MTFLIRLRQAAVRCKHDKLAAALRQTSQALEYAISDLWRSPTEDNMQRVNCLWAVGERCIKEAAKDAMLWGDKGPDAA